MILYGHKNSVISVALSPDCSYFATGSGDFRARLWKLENGQKLPSISMPPTPTFNPQPSSNSTTITPLSSATLASIAPINPLSTNLPPLREIERQESAQNQPNSESSDDDSVDNEKDKEINKMQIHSHLNPPTQEKPLESDQKVGGEQKTQEETSKS